MFECERERQVDGVTEVGEEQGEREVESEREMEVNSGQEWVKGKERERSGSRERSGEQFVLSPSPSLFFLLLPSFFFLHLWSVFFVHPLSFFFLHSPSLLFLRFWSYFTMGFVISPLVEKKYWVYPLQQICGLGFRFMEMRHFCFLFREYLIKCDFFFVTVLFKSESGRSVVENNHSKAESAGLVFPIYVWSNGFVNANLHFSALLCYPSPWCA